MKSVTNDGSLEPILRLSFYFKRVNIRVENGNIYSICNTRLLAVSLLQTTHLAQKLNHTNFPYLRRIIYALCYGMHVLASEESFCYNRVSCYQWRIEDDLCRLLESGVQLSVFNCAHTNIVSEVCLNIVT